MSLRLYRVSKFKINHISDRFISKKNFEIQASIKNSVEYF